MSELVLFLFCVLITAGLLSKTEIQIEDKGGYAENLPVTWRAKNIWVKRLFTGTSYHLYMGLFLVAFLHSVVFILDAWTLRVEFLILSFLALVTVAEDFLWFILNPAVGEETGERLYGVRNFNKEHIPWFEWFWGLPLWYWWYIPVGVILYWLAQL